MTHRRFLALAALALSGLTFAPAQAQDRPRPDAPAPGGGATSGASSSSTATSTPGGTTTASGAVRTGEQPTAAGVSGLIGQVVDAAVSSDPGTRLPDLFYSADRQRFANTSGSATGAGAGNRAGNTGAALNAGRGSGNNTDRTPTAVLDLQRAWRDKYNADFRVANPDQAFGSGFFRGGPNAGLDAARPAGARLDPATGATAGSSSSTASASSSATATDAAGQTRTAAAAANDASRTITGTPQTSSVTIPESHGLPAVTVALVREGGDWRINVPDTLTPDRLQSNLVRHLSVISQNQAAWPADRDQAQRLIAHHVLMAVMDTEATAGGATGGAAGGNTAGGTPGGTGTGGGSGNTGAGGPGGTQR